jgi:hypothetical protein
MEMIPFKLPVRIAGYAGQHDEAGAKIVDANDNYVCSTPHLEKNNPEGWNVYYRVAEFIVEAINAYGMLVNEKI